MPKMTIRQLLDALEPLPNSMVIEPVTMWDLLATLKGQSHEKRYLDGHFGSYRGYYNELHVGIAWNGADSGNNTVAGLQVVLKKALAAKTMTGYKGGEYEIDADTYVWVATDSGHCSGLFVAGVDELHGRALILLGEGEY